nr:helix-turn-helix transcriptional regulator [Moraxella sp.]
MRFDFYTPSEITDILGKRLKQQRLYQNLTQAELSQKAGIGLSTISRIESGEGGTLDNVIRYAMSVGLVNEFADLFANNPKTIDEVIAQKTSRKRASSKL